MADDHDDVDVRIRRAWADLDDGDLALEPPPSEIWAGIEEATGPPAAATARPSARGRAMPRLLAVAAAIVVVGLLAAGVATVLGRGDDVESRANLSPDAIEAPAAPHGEARLVVDGSTRSLRVSVEDLPDVADGDVLEVWLIDPDSGGLLSLGLTDGRSRLPVPDAVDTSRFSVVDVSIEPTDGDPGHSSNSVVRGRLEPV